VIVYNCSRATGEYCGQSEARVDPLESEKAGKNVYAIPAYASKKAPPSCGDNEVAVLLGSGNWTKKKDYRGSWYKKDDHSLLVVSEIGVEVSEEYTKDRPAGRHERWGSSGWEIDQELIDLEEAQAFIFKELARCDIEYNYFIDGDERLSLSKEQISQYRMQLRDYVKQGKINGGKPESPFVGG